MSTLGSARSGNDLGLLVLIAVPKIKTRGRWFGILHRSTHFLRIAHLSLPGLPDGLARTGGAGSETQSGQDIFLGK